MVPRLQSPEATADGGQGLHYRPLSMNKIEVDEGKLTSLEQVKAVFGAKWPGYFNNFSTRFPALYKGSVADERGILEALGTMELPFSAFISPKVHKYCSQKFLEQTPRKFYKAVDRVTLELGILPEGIRKLKELQSEAGSDDLKIQYFEQLQELIAPFFLN